MTTTTTIMGFENIFRILNNTVKFLVHRRFPDGRRLHRNQSSYFIHKLVPVVLLVFCVATSLSARVISPRNPSLSPVSHPHDHDSPPALSESSRDFPLDPRGKENDGSILSASSSSAAAVPASKTLFFGEDTNGVPIVIGTWFRYGSYTLAFALFGTVFLTACAATAVYYTLFVVTEPSQQIRSLTSSTSASSSSQNGGIGMVDGWNVARVLRALHLAYETYETFDPYNASCQLKTVCEIQEGPHFQGSLLKRLVHFLIHSELVQRKVENAEELQAADRVGNDPGEECREKYSECRFSINRLYERYIKL